MLALWWRSELVPSVLFRVDDRFLIAMWFELATSEDAMSLLCAKVTSDGVYLIGVLVGPMENWDGLVKARGRFFFGPTRVCDARLTILA